MRPILGVDPGKTGAIVAVDADNDCALLWVIDMPVLDKAVSPILLHGELVDATTDLWNRLDRSVPLAACAPVSVAIEKVQAITRTPGRPQGVASMFSFGQSYGVLRGYFEPRYRTVYPQPQEWMKYLGLPAKSHAPEAARAMVLRRWPDSADVFRRKADGRPDAAGIALWHAETMGRVEVGA